MNCADHEYLYQNKTQKSTPKNWTPSFFKSAFPKLRKDYHKPNGCRIFTTKNTDEKLTKKTNKQKTNKQTKQKTRKKH